MQMVAYAMDAYIRSLVRKMRCITGGATAAKWFFVAVLIALYTNVGRVDGAFISAVFAILYDIGQQDMIRKRYDGAVICLGLSFGLAAAYIRIGGPIWHLCVVLSVVFCLQNLRQYGLSYTWDIRALNETKDKLAETDIIGKSAIRVQTDSGRNYTFAWNRKEVEDALQDKDTGYSEKASAVTRSASDFSCDESITHD